MHNDNEKPFRNHIVDMPRKKFLPQLYFHMVLIYLRLVGKLQEIWNNKFHFIPNCLIVLQLKDDQIKYICYIKKY